MDIELPLLRQPLPTRKERYRHLKKLEYSRINDPYTRCRKALKTTHDIQKTVVLLNKVSIVTMLLWQRVHFYCCWHMLVLMFETLLTRQQIVLYHNCV